MTNEEKYETPEERDEAFRRFCKSKSDCNVCPTGRKLDSLRCTFAWLSLEAEEEKLLAKGICHRRVKQEGEMMIAETFTLLDVVAIAAVVALCIASILIFMIYEGE